MQVFQNGGFPKTARWMEYFSQRMAEKKPVADIVRDLEEMLITFRAEFRGSDPYREKLLLTVEPIMNFMVTRFGIRQEKYVPLFQDLSRSAQNIKPVAQAFLRFELGKVRYYGMCLIYLIHAEGIFGNAIRILYGLTLEAFNTPLTIVELNKLSVEGVRRKFLKMGPLPNCLFEGWENGHVRNSIAHCRFYYDDLAGLMYFDDFNIKTGKRTYNNSFTIEQFSVLSLKLQDVWHLVSHLILLVRLVRLVGYPNVPDAGKNLAVQPEQ